MFHVGQKVVCVDGQRRQRGKGDEVLPVYGRVYTIRDMVSFSPYDTPGIQLCEIRNTIRHYLQGMHECTFNPNRFRAAVDKKTDISIFTKMLNRNPVNETVDI